MDNWLGVADLMDNQYHLFGNSDYFTTDEDASRIFKEARSGKKTIIHNGGEYLNFDEEIDAYHHWKRTDDYHNKCERGYCENINSDDPIIKYTPEDYFQPNSPISIMETIFFRNNELCQCDFPDEDTIKMVLRNFKVFDEGWSDLEMFHLAKSAACDYCESWKIFRTPERDYEPNEVLWAYTMRQLDIDIREDNVIYAWFNRRIDKGENIPIEVDSGFWLSKFEQLVAIKHIFKYGKHSKALLLEWGSEMRRVFEGFELEYEEQEEWNWYSCIDYAWMKYLPDLDNYLLGRLRATLEVRSIKHAPWYANFALYPGFMYEIRVTKYQKIFSRLNFGMCSNFQFDAISWVNLRSAIDALPKSDDKWIELFNSRRGKEYMLNCMIYGRFITEEKLKDNQFLVHLSKAHEFRPVMRENLINIMMEQQRRDSLYKAALDVVVKTQRKEKRIFVFPVRTKITLDASKMTKCQLQSLKNILKENPDAKIDSNLKKVNNKMQELREEKKVKFETQMFGLDKEKLSQNLDILPNLEPRLINILESGDDITARLSSLMNLLETNIMPSFVNITGEVQDVIIPNLSQTSENMRQASQQAVSATKLLKILTCLVLVYIFIKYKKFRNIILVMLGIYLGVSLVQCFNVIRKAIEEHQCEPSHELTFEVQMDGEDIIPIAAKLCVLVVTAIGINKLPDNKKIDQFMSRITNFSRMIKGMDDLCNYTSAILPKLTEWWHQLILGETDYVTPINIPDIDSWIAEIKHYSVLSNKDEILSSCEEVEKMAQLYPKGLDFLRQARNENWGPKILNIISQANTSARALYGLASSSGKINLTEFRDEPLTLMLSGPAGVGKSFLTRTIASDLMFEAGLPKEKHTSNIYTRNSSSEFYDGYTGQFVFLDDEFLSTKDTENKPNIDVSDIILLHNTTTNTVNMAELIQKSCTYFTSKVIMLTTNVPQLKNYIQSLNHPEALYRRINPNLLVEAKPEFQRNPEGKGAMDKILDHSKLPKGKDGKKFYMNAWNFWYIDPETGKKLDNRAYNYLEVITRLKSMLRERLDKCKDVSEQIKAYKDSNGIEGCSTQFEVQMDDYEDAVEMLTTEEIEGDEFMSEFMRDFNTKIDKACLRGRYKNIFQDRVRWILDKRSKLTDNSLMVWMKTKYQTLDLLSTYNDWKNAFNTSMIVHKDKIAEILSISKYLGLILAGMAIAWSVFKIFGRNNSEEVDNNDNNKEHIVELKPKKEVKFLPHVPDEYRYLVVEQYSEMEFSNEKYPVFWTNIVHQKCNRNNKKYVFIDEHPRCVNCLEIRFDLVKELYNGGKSNLVDWDLHEIQTNSKDGKPRSDGRSGRSNYKAFSHKNGKSQPYYEMQMGEMNTEQLRDYERMCADSLLDLFIWSDSINNWKHMHNIFMIKGRVGLTSSHLLSYLRINKIQTLMVKGNSLQQGVILEVKDLIWRELKTQEGKVKDACLIFFPVDDMPCFRDRTKHIIRRRETKQIPDNNNSDLYGKLVTLNFDKGYPIVRTADIKEIYSYGSLMQTSRTTEQLERMVYDNLCYKAKTVKGECGGPLFINNNFFQCKIVGLHNGLQIGTSEIASGTLVTYEDIEPHLESFIAQSFTWEENDLEDYIGELKTNVIRSDEEIVLSDGGIFENTNFIMIGNSKLVCSQPEKTKLVQSPICGEIELFDVVYPNKHAPAVMGVGRNTDGEMVNVLEQGLKKQGRQNIIIDRKLIERAKTSYFSKLQHLENELGTRRLLTLKETIQGIDGTLYFSGMNRKSSMGFPFAAMKLSKPGKKAYFGSEEYDFTSLEYYDFQYRYDHALYQLKNNVRPVIVFTDLCKDEKRKIEKVLDCKTRTFSGGNALLQSLFNTYFGTFFAMLKYNKIDVESCVGVNVYSRDIGRMRDKLRTRGNSVVLGDFSGFDASLDSRVFKAIVDGINEWYDDSEENMKIREFLWNEIYNSLHIKNNVLYCWIKNQPSGQPATAEVNSIYQSLIFRIATYKIMDKYNIQFDFNDKIALILYGDDSVGAFDEQELGKYFNYKELTLAFKELGMDYTDESKQESEVLWRSIDEVSFLKRKFVYSEELRRYIAPLEFDSIFGMAYWIQKGPNIKKQLAINLQQFLSEMAIHGEEVYNSVSKSVKKLCKRERICMEVKPYNSHLIAMLNETIIGTGGSNYGEDGFSI